jgi:hypothetical protein
MVVKRNIKTAFPRQGAAAIHPRCCSHGALKVLSRCSKTLKVLLPHYTKGAALRVLSRCCRNAPDRPFAGAGNITAKATPVARTRPDEGKEL